MKNIVTVIALIFSIPVLLLCLFSKPGRYTEAFLIEDRVIGE